MSRITDYGFLFQTTFGTSKTNLINNIQLSQMNSSSVQKQLKAAGIDTNSKKYKAALSEMMKNGNGAMFTNVQAIKNLMSQYVKNYGLRFFISNNIWNIKNKFGQQYSVVQNEQQFCTKTIKSSRD